jgi:hypothetical protein
MTHSGFRFGFQRPACDGPFSPLKNSIFDFASGSRIKDFSRIFPNETGLFLSLKTFSNFFFDSLPSLPWSVLSNETHV